MCGRYTLTHPDQMTLRFDLPEGAPALEPSYNVAPSQTVPVVSLLDGQRVLRTLKWGFTPAWAKDSSRPAPINARAETLSEKPTFRQALARHRGLLVADGFYEWQARPGTTKQPYYFRLASGDLFAFAGLATDDTEDATCALITTTPNELVAPVHNRMPVILRREMEDIWLDPGITNPDLLRDCLVPYPAAEMVGFPVSTRVSYAGNNAPDLIATIG